MIFLAHGPTNEQSLDDHLEYVAKRSKKLAADSEFPTSDIAYYAGLFHDIGKLNPWYQETFQGNDEMASKYERIHSPYSGWITKHVLQPHTVKLHLRDIHRVLLIIYAHHGKLDFEPGNYRPTATSGSLSTSKVIVNLKTFVKQTKNNDLLKFLPNIVLNEKYFKFDNKIKTKSNENPIDAYLQCNYFFSCVLQADRGSFSDFEIKIIDSGFKLDINKLHGTKETNPKLTIMRQKFANYVRDKLDPTHPIAIINAPTGAGKTSVFLDSIKKYNPDRVFYFSPLLALTDDMADKVSKITNSKDVLVYNHTFSDTLDKIDEKNTETAWDFDHEAFNEKMVITTTQRLLMSIYSNYHKDKIKFASFRNSLLILDEVQTLPKFLLRNLICIFNMMTKYLNTKILLVSATIPYELRNIVKYNMQKNDLDSYLDIKSRKIILKETLELDNIKNNTMIMLNTRKDAKNVFEKLKQNNVYYVSSGIKKIKREQIMSQKIQDGILVCTQVLEAGVDISFNCIWRQMAPLDNIIQVLGRLDREAQDANNTAFIFDINSSSSTPYSSLEFQESQKILRGLDSKIFESKILYDKLDEYYQIISTKNNTQHEEENTLDGYFEKLDFKKIWDVVQKNMGEQYYDSVYLPKSEAWGDVRRDLLSKTKSKIKQHAKLTALLPISKWKLKDYFDQELWEDNILLPKEDKLDDIYDEQIGLDKWTQKP